MIGGINEVDRRPVSYGALKFFAASRLEEPAHPRGRCESRARGLAYAEPLLHRQEENGRAADHQIDGGTTGVRFKAGIARAVVDTY